MIRQGSLVWAILFFAAGLLPAWAQGPAVGAKQFPTGYFYRYHKAPLKEKERLLADLDATLIKLNREKLGLIAKGAVIDRLGPDQKTYRRLAILDESGLIINARKVPNLYYRYAGPGPINPNVYLVIKNARVDFPESYRRTGLVVEGDFVAYAHKFVTAILENLEAAEAREDLQPGRKAK
jgi:hypothetical protein